MFIKVLSDGVLDEKMKVCDNRQDLMFVYLLEKRSLHFLAELHNKIHDNCLANGFLCFHGNGCMKGRFRLKLWFLEKVD